VATHEEPYSERQSCIAHSSNVADMTMQSSGASCVSTGPASPHQRTSPVGTHRPPRRQPRAGASQRGNEIRSPRLGNAKLRRRRQRRSRAAAGRSEKRHDHSLRRSRSFLRLRQRPHTDWEIPLVKRIRIVAVEDVPVPRNRTTPIPGLHFSDSAIVRNWLIFLAIRL